MLITPEQNRRINNARMLAENCRKQVADILKELIGSNYDPANAAAIDALNQGKSLASDTRLAIIEAVDFELLKQHPKPSLLTEREQQAIARIERVLHGEGQDPQSGPGAWADCGEVDVPILLSLVERLTK